jgi:hypothetical protein
MESRRNARDYQIERRKKSAVSLQKSPINARSFFNINALLNAGRALGCGEVDENIVRDQ